MAKAEGLIIKKSDHKALTALARSVADPTRELLERELDRASVVSDDEVPADVIAMNSKVTYLDLETNEERQVTLVFPNESDVSSGKISILAPIGGALIGLKVGQEINWPLPTGAKKLIKVTAVQHSVE